MRTRRTLRGHLAKIYAMHWGTDSRCVGMVGRVAGDGYGRPRSGGMQRTPDSQTLQGAGEGGEVL